MEKWNFSGECLLVSSIGLNDEFSRIKNMYCIVLHPRTKFFFSYFLFFISFYLYIYINFCFNKCRCLLYVHMCVGVSVLSVWVVCMLITMYVCM